MLRIADQLNEVRRGSRPSQLRIGVICGSARLANLRLEQRCPIERRPRLPDPFRHHTWALYPSTSEEEMATVTEFGARLDRLPMLNFAAFLDGRRDQVAAEIGRACETIGFF